MNPKIKEAMIAKNKETSVNSGNILEGLMKVEIKIKEKINAGEYRFSDDGREHSNYPWFNTTLRAQATGKVKYPWEGYDWLLRYTNAMLAMGLARIDGTFPTETIYQDFMDGKAITYAGSFDSCCFDCGSRFSFIISLEGGILNIHVESDSICEKNREYSIEVDFPTGEIVIDDWPPFFPNFMDQGIISDKDFDVNYVYGIRANSEKAVKDGYGHFFVGNTSPSIWKEGDGLRVGYLDEDNEDIAIGSVCTDLWWVTMIDVSIYKKYLAAIGQEYSEELVKRGSYGTANIIKIEPGRYRIKPYYGLGYPDGPDPDTANGPFEVYATIERID